MKPFSMALGVFVLLYLISLSCVHAKNRSIGSPHKCIVYIEAAFAIEGAPPIPHKHTCDSDDDPMSITLLGGEDWNLVSGNTMLTIPRSFISDDNTVMLDHPSADKIIIEKAGRPRAEYSGDFNVLVVRLYDDYDEPTYSVDEIGEHVFDTSEGAVSLRERILSCSGKDLNFVPAEGSAVTNGVYNAKSQNRLKGVDRGVCRSTARKLARDGTKNGIIDEYTFMMVICPPTVNFGSAAGVAYVNGYESWFRDKYGSSPFVQFHEIGHNLNFRHSGEGTATYGDPLGIMGARYINRPNWGRMCFNAAKSHNTGWYPNGYVEPTIETYNGYISDVNSYFEGSFPAENHDVPVKIFGTDEDPLYFMLHRAEGITKDYRSAYARNHINKVNVISQKDHDQIGQQSWTVAHLGAGESYFQENWDGTSNTLVISVCSIEVGSPDLAEVIVYLDGVNFEECSSAPSPGSLSPTKSPVNNPPTKSPVNNPPTKSPDNNPPTKSPDNNPPTKAPVNNPPTKSPVRNPPTKAPVNNPPTKSPVQNPTTSVPTPSPTKPPTVSAAPVGSCSVDTKTNCCYPEGGWANDFMMSICEKRGCQYELSDNGRPYCSLKSGYYVCLADNCGQTCMDSKARFYNNGRKRRCAWAAKKPELRCKRRGVQKHCPYSCNKCVDFSCADSRAKFDSDGKKRTCRWAAKKPDKIEIRCKKTGVASSCRATCGFC